MRRKKIMLFHLSRLVQKKFRFPVILLLGLVYCSFLYLYAESNIIELPRENAPIYFYSNQTSDDLRKTIREAIDNAKTSITLAIFSLSDPQIIGTLRKKLMKVFKLQL